MAHGAVAQTTSGSWNHELLAIFVCWVEDKNLTLMDDGFLKAVLPAGLGATGVAERLYKSCLKEWTVRIADRRKYAWLAFDATNRSGEAGESICLFEPVLKAEYNARLLMLQHEGVSTPVFGFDLSFNDTAQRGLKEECECLRALLRLDKGWNLVDNGFFPYLEASNNVGDRVELSFLGLATRGEYLIGDYADDIRGGRSDEALHSALQARLDHWRTPIEVAAEQELEGVDGARVAAWCQLKYHEAARSIIATRDAMLFEKLTGKKMDWGVIDRLHYQGIVTYAVVRGHIVKNRGRILGLLEVAARACEDHTFIVEAVRLDRQSGLLYHDINIGNGRCIGFYSTWVKA
jgi:hypothetical protein